MSEQSPLQWQSLEPSAQALEFMAHQEEVVRQICGVFQISPQELGAATNLNARERERYQKDFKAKLRHFLARKLGEEQKG